MMLPHANFCFGVPRPQQFIAHLKLMSYGAHPARSSLPEPPSREGNSTVQPGSAVTAQLATAPLKLRLYSAPLATSFFQEKPLQIGNTIVRPGFAEIALWLTPPLRLKMICCSVPHVANFCQEKPSQIGNTIVRPGFVGIALLANIVVLPPLVTSACDFSFVTVAESRRPRKTSRTLLATIGATCAKLAPRTVGRRNHWHELILAH